MRGRISALEAVRRGGRDRVQVMLDGRYAFSISADLAQQLAVGQSIDEQQSATLLGRDERGRALDLTIQLLARRPRSERELRDRLVSKRFDDETIDATLVTLRQRGLVNDAAFAQYWVEQRLRHRPSGARRLEQELRQKGVQIDVPRLIAEQIEEEDALVDPALRAALQRARSLALTPRPQFERRLTQFLLRRGFDFATARQTVRQVWEARTLESGLVDDQSDSGDPENVVIEESS